MKRNLDLQKKTRNMKNNDKTRNKKGYTEKIVACRERNKWNKDAYNQNIKK